MATQPKPPRIVDCAEIQEIYSDKMVSASFAGGGLIVTLGCTRLQVEGLDPQAKDRPSSVVVNNRLALSPQLAVDLVNALTQVINAANTAAQQAAAKAAGTAPASPAAGAGALAATAPTTKQ